MTAASFFKLPYRLIFAVVTLNSLYIYDTESVQPIAIVAGLHYAAVTDIAWYIPSFRILFQMQSALPFSPMQHCRNYLIRSFF